MLPESKKPLYKRVLLKFSGEALMGKYKFGIDTNVIEYMIREIKPLLDLGIQLGIVIGGGNFFRGKIARAGISRITVDQMGMIATMLNALAMRDVFEKNGVNTRLMSAIPIHGIVNAYDRHKAMYYLQRNYTMIFAGGSGNPLVTTDIALAMRGIELNADILLKATNVDGVYSSDPAINPDATFYSHLTYQEALSKELQVMDLAAFGLCHIHKMRLRIFNMHKPGALLRIVLGEEEGTLVD